MRLWTAESGFESLRPNHSPLYRAGARAAPPNQPLDAGSAGRRGSRARPVRLLVAASSCLGGSSPGSAGAQASSLALEVWPVDDRADPWMRTLDLACDR